MIFTNPPDRATVIPSPRHTHHFASVSIEALEQAGRRTPPPRMQSLRRRASKAGLITPLPPSVVPNEALAVRPRTKTPSRRARSPKQRSRSPSPEPEEEEAPAPAPAPKRPVIKGAPPPAPPPAPANSLDASGLISPDALLPPRPPTAYDQLRHLTRRINGVFMRYERPASMYARPGSAEALALEAAEAEVEESPLFIKHSLDELLKACEKAARDRKLSLVEALEGAENPDGQKEMLALVQSSSNDDDAPKDDEEAKLASAIQRQQMATSRMASLHSSEMEWLRKLQGAFDELMSKLEASQRQVVQAEGEVAELVEKVEQTNEKLEAAEEQVRTQSSEGRVKK